MAADDRRLCAALEGKIGDVLDRDAPFDRPFWRAEPATQGARRGEFGAAPLERRSIALSKPKQTENNL